MRLQVEGVIALALAIVACGLTAAMWILRLEPLFTQYGLGVIR